MNSFHPVCLRRGEPVEELRLFGWAIKFFIDCCWFNDGFGEQQVIICHEKTTFHTKKHFLEQQVGEGNLAGTRLAFG